MPTRYDPKTAYKPAIARVLEVLQFWAEPDRTVFFSNRMLAAAVGLQSTGQIPGIRRQLVEDGLLTILETGPHGTKAQLSRSAIRKEPIPPISSLRQNAPIRELTTELLNELLGIYAEGRLSLRQMSILRRRLDPTFEGHDGDWHALLFALRPGSRADSEHKRIRIPPKTTVDKALAQLDDAVWELRDETGQSTNDYLVQLIALYATGLTLPRPDMRIRNALLQSGLSFEELHSTARSVIELYRALAARVHMEQTAASTAEE